jgi:hypothetical protein
MNMTIALMRNRVSTEFRKVEHGSDEYLELQAQRDPNDGMPVWEETSLPHAIEVSKRLEAGNPVGSDIGTAQQPVGKMAGAQPRGFFPANYKPEPLPSELEAGAVQEEEGFANLPRYETFAEEQPLTMAMESPTDTGVGGTEPDLTEHKKGRSGARMKKNGNGAPAADAPQAEQAPAQEEHQAGTEPAAPADQPAETSQQQ